MKKALLSTSNKNGLADLAGGLLKLGYELLATRGTAQFLQEQGFTTTEVAEYTDYPELLGGKVKTLHPKIFGGLLATPEQYTEMQSYGISPIDVVVVNLYPDEIDIGGVALLRAAAKNYRYVLSLCEEADYQPALNFLATQQPDVPFRKRLAAKAFAYTARYDAKLAQSLSDEEFPQTFVQAFSKAGDLRYGENPDQRAAFYIREGGSRPLLLKGEELSYNNLLDSDAAIRLVSGFNEPTCAVIKHTNPCGTSSAPSLRTAFQQAYDADSLSAYGGIIAFNKPVDAQTAAELKDKFVEVLIAPDYEEGVLAMLQNKKKLRILKASLDANPYTFSAVTNGMLYQSASTADFATLSVTCPTDVKPTSEQLADLIFAAKVNRCVKSNGIVLAKNQTTVGIGAGQMSRLDATTLAILKAQDRAQGAVLSSDGFFPFSDSIEQAAKAGVVAIIQPGGSIRDDDVIKACNTYEIAMVMTGIRTFKH